MSKIRTYEKNTREYKNLKMFAEMLNYISTDGTRYIVADTYFDYGQDWMWTTINARNDSDTYYTGWYQALTPKMQEDVIDAIGIRELARIADEYSKKR